MTIEDYRDMFDLVRQDVDCAVASNCTYLTINNLAVTDADLYQQFYRNGNYWHLTQYALQTTFFISFGRIFDRKRDTVSIGELVDTTIEHPGFFSKTVLREEKIKACSGREPDWLDDYIAKAWEPTRHDLLPLRNALDPHIQKFRDIYQPIRHTYFAHRGKAGADVINALFAKTVIKDVEEILRFLYTLICAIRNMSLNGWRPDLTRFNDYQSYVGDIKNRTEALIRSIP